MARVVWARRTVPAGRPTTCSPTPGHRTVTIDLGMPDDQVVEPGTGSASFASAAPVTAFRWDPNEDRGARRWYLQDVQLRSDFATGGSFPDHLAGRGLPTGRNRDHHRRHGSQRLQRDDRSLGCSGESGHQHHRLEHGGERGWTVLAVPADHSRQCGDHCLCRRGAGGDRPAGADAQSDRIFRLGGAFRPHLPGRGVGIRPERPDAGRSMSMSTTCARTAPGRPSD